MIEETTIARSGKEEVGGRETKVVVGIFLEVEEEIATTKIMYN